VTLYKHEHCPNGTVHDASTNHHNILYYSNILDRRYLLVVVLPDKEQDGSFSILNDSVMVRRIIFE
jgi:hypothetical protein